MELINSLFPLFATCGAVVGVYVPISFSTLSSNSASTSEQSMLVSALGNTQQEQTSNFKNQRKLSIEGPILSCNQHEKNYEVYLDVSKEKGGQAWNKDSAKDLVTFKVVDAKNGKTVMWGPEALEENKWSIIEDFALPAREK